MSTPEPLVPAEVELRDFHFMPLDVMRLRDSDFATLAGGDAFKAAILLWCASWHQMPAASLPNDDRLLAKYSGAGAKWAKVKRDAMRGFILCSDGRFYHPVIAEKAIEAWLSRRSASTRGKAGAQARWAQLQSQSNSTSNSTSNAPANSTSNAQAMPENGKRQGQGIDRDRDKKQKAVAALPDWLPLDAWEAWRAERRERKKPMTGRAESLALGMLAELRGQGNDPVAVIAQSIANGWSGLFALRVNGQGAPPVNSNGMTAYQQMQVEKHEENKRIGEAIHGKHSEQREPIDITPGRVD